MRTDQAKADNKKAADAQQASVQVIAPKPTQAPTVRDITNAVANAKLSPSSATQQDSLSKRFDASSTATSPVETPLLANSPAPPSPVVTENDNDEDISYEEAMKRLEQRKHEEEVLACSLENPGACTMCSG